MGLDLSKTKGKKKEVAPPPKKRKKEATKKPVTKKSKVVEELEDDEDEVVIPTHTPTKDEAVAVRAVGSFEGGLVHPSLRNGVNAHRRRSEESDIFGSVITNALLVDGVFFGSIYVKSSFAKRTGGSALL